MLVVVLFLLLFPATLAQNLTSEEYYLLPPAFHLDNYERCLSQDHGLYCLGTFELSTEKEPNHLYSLMKKYSENGHTFNRTLIRRGYCVSARCPIAERNTSLRFERCAAQWGSVRALRTSLKTLHYCRSAKAHRLGDSLDESYEFFMRAVYTLLTLNFIGTLYDFLTDGNTQRNRLLLFWSARSNWHRLTSTNVHADPRLAKLAPIQGHRILAIASMVYVHAAIASYKQYPYNPQFLEVTMRTLLGSFLTSSVVLVQVFVIISCFLNTYNLLLYSQKNPLSYKMVPLSVIKRLTRITPLYLLVMSYAVTWWNYGESPLWSAVIGGESRVCRDKFWYHMFYFSNLVEPNRTCLMQTWFLAADMQLNILTTVLVITFTKFKQKRTATILGRTFLASCVIASIVAYIFEWKPVNQFVTPERLRIMFADEVPSTFRSASFTRMHLATWAYLPAAFLGMTMAYVHHDMQERGVKGPEEFKWLPFLHTMGLPMMVAWTLLGLWTREHTSRLVSAAYVGFERLACGFILASIVFGGINVDGNLSRFFAWQGWNVMGRLSLAVMLIHWCVNLNIIISRPNTAPVSLLTFAVDAATTGFFTYLIAVPLTILVEMPMQKTLDYIIFELLLKFR